jgi:1,4-alpha-glucan branching enzyme
MDSCVGPAGVAPHLRRANALLAKKGQPPLTEGQLSSQINQLKALIDICHLYGIAVIPDVVYNHAGGGFDPQSIDHFDFPARPDHANSLYFSGSGHAGGRAPRRGRAIGQAKSRAIFNQRFHRGRRRCIRRQAAQRAEGGSTWRSWRVR